MFGRLTVVVALAVTALVVASGTGAAPKPIFVEGQLLGGGGTDSCEPLGGDVYKCVWQAHYDLGGDLHGSVVGQHTAIVNCALGTRKGKGTEVFTGVVAGVGSGTLTWTFITDTAFDCPGGGNWLLFTGTAKVKSGTGHLAKLKGTIVIGPLAYSGVLF